MVTRTQRGKLYGGYLTRAMAFGRGATPNLQTPSREEARKIKTQSSRSSWPPSHRQKQEKKSREITDVVMWVSLGRQERENREMVAKGRLGLTFLALKIKEEGHSA